MIGSTANNGLLSMPPNSQPANQTHGGTAASQPSTPKNTPPPASPAAGRCHFSAPPPTAMRLRLLAILGFVATVFALWLAIGPGRRVDFQAEVKPLLNKKCMACHGGVKQAGGFSLLTREEALKPTDSGKPAIVPGDPAASEFIRRLTCADPEERMPYRKEPLVQAEVDLLARWVAQGADWGQHWAYSPVRQPVVPGREWSLSRFFGKKETAWGRNEIDAFVLARLRKEHLSPSPEADKNTLLRRVALDLTGLPPSEKLAALFLNDTSSTSYEWLVDSLLAAPAFGERWASVWLDLARYADSKGYERDARRFAWRYRDWVIRAFNADMPYDQFLTEQIAGDLLPEPTDFQRIATTFHRNTPTNDEGGTDNEEYRTAAVLDRVNTTWEAAMGTTFACVQCHSHPYDPFFHEEYYQFAAFFNNTRDADTYDDFPLLRVYAGADSTKFLELKSWLENNVQAAEKQRVLNLVQLWQPAWSSVETDSLENCALLDTKWLGMSHRSSARLRQVGLDGKQKLIVRMSVGKPGGAVTLRVDKKDGPVLATIPCPKNTGGWSLQTVDIQPFVGRHDVFLVYENPKIARKPEAFGMQFDWFAFTEKFPGTGKPGAAEAEKKFNELLRGGCETVPVMFENPSDYQRITYVFERGNWLVPGAVVQPGTPKYLPPMPENAPPNRLGLAQWLTNKQNPLTARVMVNRLWEQLFGTGLVETLEDFGSQGAEPSHPELLDWLAWRLMHDHQWSLKRTLRDIVLSATYRQKSEATPALFARDPQNRLLARGPRVRLSAEQIRDQALAVSGLLSDKMFGKPVMPYQPKGIWQTPWNGDSWKTSEGRDRHRRAVYTFWKRSSPYPSAMNFDGAARQVCTARRVRTNTPLQALNTLNDPVFVECAQFFALKLLVGDTLSPTMSLWEWAAAASSTAEKQQNLPKISGQNHPSSLVPHAYEQAVGRPVPLEKLAVLEKLHADALARFRGKPADAALFLENLPPPARTPEVAALAAVCNAVLNLDEVLVKW
ncbi:MAG: DUF1553 domain-containing protein [Saprospiraceae bacterium]